VVRGTKDDKFQPYVSSIIIIIQMFFQLVLIFASNPFARYDYVPIDGYGLNPLLQDPGMIIHPPTLFIGYTALFVPFAYALAGLIKGDDSWIYKVRSWNLFSWLFLTLGIALGGWWSYHMLGWGGFWAWDPIENSSLMPWLTLTAFLHSLMIQEGKRGMKIWNVLLPTFSFLLVIYATFLTRSGIIQSIHSFGESAIGTYFLGFIFFSGVASLGLIFYRYNDLKSRNIFEDYFSKETTFLFNNLIFTILTLLILFGTTFPLLSEAIRGYQVRVGPGYFNETFSPLAWILIVLMGLCPLIAWRKASFVSLRRNLTYPFALMVLATVVAIVLGITKVRPIMVITAVVFNLSSILQEFYRASEPDSGKSIFNRVKLLGSSIKYNQRRYGGYLIHFSIIVMLIGVAGSSISEESEMVTLGINESFEMGKYKFILRDITSKSTDALHIYQVDIDLYVDEQLANHVSPTIDYFVNKEQDVRRPYIHTHQMTDIYVIYEYSEQMRATFTFKVIPYVALLWLGIAMSIVGVIVAGWPKSLTQMEVRA
jgi:cytochrome c-type biogenesis protein CcmF